MKNKFIKSILGALSIAMILASCSTSNDVISDSFVQKRKYRKGFYVDKSTKKDKVDETKDMAVIKPELKSKVNIVTEQTSPEANHSTITEKSNNIDQGQSQIALDKEDKTENSINKESLSPAAESTVETFTLEPAKKSRIFEKLSKDRVGTENIAAVEIEDFKDNKSMLKKGIWAMAIGLGLAVIAFALAAGSGASGSGGLAAIAFIFSLVGWILFLVGLIVLIVYLVVNA